MDNTQDRNNQLNYNSNADLSIAEQEFGDEKNYTYKSHRKIINLVKPHRRTATAEGRRTMPMRRQNQGSASNVTTAYQTGYNQSNERLQKGVSAYQVGNPSVPMLNQKDNPIVENEKYVHRGNHLQFSVKSMNEKENMKMFSLDRDKPGT